MENQDVKTEIIEEIGIDEIIDEQMDQKDPDAVCELDEKDKAKIKAKLRAELEQELGERLDREIEEQAARKLQEQERKAQLEKTIKKACSVIAAGAAVCCSALLAVGIAKLFIYKNDR